MAHLPNLIIDLALILAAATVVTFLFKWLKQPLVLGYIIAGFLVGPYFKWLPTVSEIENITIWAEIGVIFLLFSLGLEFSFKKLLKVGAPASITAVVEVVAMVAIGYFVGKAMGWSTMDSLFLGGILSISSTTIIIRAFDELGFKTKQFAGLVFGVLIVEDLVAIVLMVLLSTLAVSRQFAGTEMLVSVLKLTFFLAIWFAMGIFFIPTLLRKAKPLMSDEMLLIISISLCLGMVVFADAVGFSPALGAFVMGSILAETTKAEKIEHLIKPVKDLFGAIFFVSVGMLIDPAVLSEYLGPIAILCAVTVVGKILSTSAGALLSGQSLQTSIQSGFSLAQIGEFSFIIATLGLTLKVTSDFLYPIAVAVSAVTTLTTPYLIKSSSAFYHWLLKHLPEKVIRGINKYTSAATKVSVISDWKMYMRSSIVTSILLSVIMVSIILVSSRYVVPWANQQDLSLLIKIISCVVILVVLSPFIWAFAIRGPGDAYRDRLKTVQYRDVLNIISLIKLCIAAFFMGFLLNQFFNIYVGILFTVLMILLLIAFSSRLQKFYSWFEHRFFSNLNQRETDQNKSNRTELAPWNAHIAPITIHADSSSVGKTLFELKWREQIGINVVLIKRGDYHIATPGKDQMIFPGDELLILGTDLQIQRLKVLIRAQTESENKEVVEVDLYKFLITDDSSLRGQTIRLTGLRQHADALVVGIERNNERILNPESDFILQAHDELFIVGNKKKLRTLIPSL